MWLLLQKQTIHSMYWQLDRQMGNTTNVHRDCDMFWISNFRCVLNVVCFLMGNLPASEF